MLSLRLRMCLNGCPGQTGSMGRYMTPRGCLHGGKKSQEQGLLGRCLHSLPHLGQLQYLITRLVNE